METNKILKSDKVKKIYLVYKNDLGLKTKVKVQVRYMDFNSCFFATEMPAGFKKPKSNLPVEIQVYTAKGVYIANVLLKDTVMSLNELLYEVSSPKNWVLKNMRIVDRKILDLKLLIQYEDGFSLEVNSYDVSEKGISFVTEKRLPSIYKKMSCKLMLILPADYEKNTEEVAIAFDGLCSREANNNFQDNLYAYKFINAMNNDVLILKKYVEEHDLKYVI